MEASAHCVSCCVTTINSNFQILNATRDSNTMTDPSLSTACSALSQPGETSTNTCSTTDGCKIDHACSVNISMPARQSDTDRHFGVRAAIKGVDPALAWQSEQVRLKHIDSVFGLETVASGFARSETHQARG